MAESANTAATAAAQTAFARLEGPLHRLVGLGDALILLSTSNDLEAQDRRAVGHFAATLRDLAADLQDRFYQATATGREGAKLGETAVKRFDLDDLAADIEEMRTGVGLLAKLAAEMAEGASGKGSLDVERVGWLAGQLDRQGEHLAASVYNMTARSEAEIKAEAAEAPPVVAG